MKNSFLPSFVIPVLPSELLLVKQRYIGTFQLFPFIAASAIIQQSITHCSGDEQEEDMKKKKDDGNSSFSDTRSDQRPQQARGNTPDARNFSLVPEATPMFNTSSEFFASANSGMKATSTPNYDNFSFDQRETPKYSTSKLSPFINSGMKANGKTPSDAFSFGIGATPKYSTSKFCTLGGEVARTPKEVARTPDDADHFPEATDLAVETPIIDKNINIFSQQQEVFSCFQQDELDTSNYGSTKGRDSCDTVQENMEVYYNVGETFFNALLDLKEKGLS